MAGDVVVRERQQGGCREVQTEDDSEKPRGAPRNAASNCSPNSIIGTAGRQGQTAAVIELRYTARMFPVSDVIPSRTTPYVTIGIIALNTFAFLYRMADERPGAASCFSWNTAPYPPTSRLPSIVTSMFLHSGWLHFGGNMLYLWIFGDNVEDRLGHGRFLVFYCSAARWRCSGRCAMNPDSLVPMIGASGAIAGVMGAYFVLYPHSRVLTAVFILFFLDLVEIPAIFFLGIWFLMQLFSGVGSIGASSAGGGVAFWAHIAGFLTGLTVGLFQRWRDSTRPQYW